MYKLELLDTKAAADFLGISKAFLERDRWRGPTIPYFRIGNGHGAVRYKRSDLIAYVESRRVNPADQ